MRQVHGDVAGIVYPHDPEPSDIAGLVDRTVGYDLVVVGTVNATAGQAALVDELLSAEALLVTVAMREPQDLSSYPLAETHICTYSSHLPSVHALAQAIFGQLEFGGRLPVSIPGLNAVGHGL